MYLLIVYISSWSAYIAGAMRSDGFRQRAKTRATQPPDARSLSLTRIRKQTLKSALKQTLKSILIKEYANCVYIH